jgi:hypothetical protein
MPNQVRMNEPISFLYRFDNKQQQWNKKLQEHGWTLRDDYHRPTGRDRGEVDQGECQARTGDGRIVLSGHTAERPSGRQ